MGVKQMKDWDRGTTAAAVRLMRCINTSLKQLENEMCEFKNSSSQHFVAVNYCFSDVSVLSLPS